MYSLQMKNIKKSKKYVYVFGLYDQKMYYGVKRKNTWTICCIVVKHKKGKFLYM